MGVSADPVDRQKEFDQQNDFGFPLLSDQDRRVSRQFGVKRPGPLPSRRQTFVIDTDRRVLGTVRSETNMNEHADRALEILRERESGRTA